MSEPSKLKILAWRFFFRIAPHWLIKKWQMFMFRRYAKHHPIELERQVREAITHQLRRVQSEDERSALTKHAVNLLLHPEAEKLRFSQSGPHR